jgi:hypothetical protein
MGALMPVGSGPDAEIISALNNVFSGKNLATLRDHKSQTGESLFDKYHKLRRVAFRIGAYPARDYSPDDAKRKWFYFLHQVLPPATEKAIKRILNDAIRPDSPITAVQFFVEENAAAAAPHLYPNNTASLASFLDPTGNYYWVRLIVKQQLDDVGEDQPDKPNDHDKDDGGNDLERLINWPALKMKHSVFAKKAQKRFTRSRKPK